MLIVEMHSPVVSSGTAIMRSWSNLDPNVKLSFSGIIGPLAVTQHASSESGSDRGRVPDRSPSQLDPMQDNKLHKDEESFHTRCLLITDGWQRDALTEK
jgi:hypothetical protein